MLFRSKQSKDDNFQGTGRTLDSAPPQPTRASVPARTANQPKATSPGRTLGRVQDSSSAGDPRAAAAAAAEARANKPVTGDLAKKLDEQKRQTRNQTLQQAADENRLQRDADAAAEARNYN